MLFVCPLIGGVSAVEPVEAVEFPSGDGVPSGVVDALTVTSSSKAASLERNWPGSNFSGRPLLV